MATVLFTFQTYYVSREKAYYLTNGLNICV